MNAAYLEVERNRGASLPHRNADPILRLKVHYFEPAEFMLEQLERLDGKAAGGRGLSHGKIIERRYFLMFWLSGLYVVMEGLEKLPLDMELKNRPLEIPMIADRIPPLIELFNEHRDSLRLLRNAQAHYQKTADKHVQFFDDRDRLNWAKSIHADLKRIFSDYRVMSSIVYAIAGRQDELQIKVPRNNPAGKIPILQR